MMQPASSPCSPARGAARRFLAAEKGAFPGATVRGRAPSAALDALGDVATLVFGNIRPQWECRGRRRASHQGEHPPWIRARVVPKLAPWVYWGWLECPQEPARVSWWLWWRGGARSWWMDFQPPWNSV